MPPKLWQIAAAVCLALAASAAFAADAPEPAREPPPAFVGLGSPAVGAPGGLAGAAAPPTHPIELSAYAIVGGSWTQEDPQFLPVGRNNGFTLADARIELTGRPIETVWLYLSLDGAVPLRAGADPLQGRRAVELKDAYGVWAPGYHLRVQAGQFKAPQDLEELLEETELRFPSRSIVSDGVQPPQGYSANGLGLGRELGLALGTDSVPLPFGSFAAQLAITNGNGENQLVNDTQSPSFSGRLAITLASIVQLGADAYFTPRASGTQPNLFRDDVTGAGGDLRVEWSGLHLLALAQWRSTHHVTAGGPDEIALGLSGEVAFRYAFVEPALRISTLDPSNQVPNAAISHTTVGLNLYAPGGVARLSAAYTHRAEQPGRELANDGFDLAAQVRF